MKSRNYKRRFTRNNNQEKELVSKYEYNVVVGSKMYQKALQSKAKYLEMAKESFTAGDRVLGETYLQHADHYARILNEAHDIQKSNRQNSNQHAEPTTEEITLQNSDEINTSEIKTDISASDQLANIMETTENLIQTS